MPMGLFTPAVIIRDVKATCFSSGVLITCLEQLLLHKRCESGGAVPETSVNAPKKREERGC